MAADPTLDDRIDALYTGPAEAFIAARDALSKQLKAEGDKDAAAAVKARRRPTVAAWAVNQLAHRERRDVAKLLDLGERLRAAHEDLLAGSGDAGIRKATTERRKLVASLADRAVALLGGGGESQREAVTDTLDAAVADPDAGIAVQEGRLAKELPAPSGFGGELAFAALPAASPRESARDRTRREERRAARAAARTDENEPTRPTAPAARQTPDAPLPKPAERREAAKRLKALEKEADERAKAAQLAAREAAAARQEVSRIQDELVTANAKAKTADEKARLAQWASATAQQDLRAARD
jgi:hypothetical protein